MDVKPCPACGGTEFYIKRNVQAWHFYVLCSHCSMRGPEKGGDDETCAIAAWNALPRREDIEQLNREADFLAEHLEWAKQETQEGESK